MKCIKFQTDEIVPKLAMVSSIVNSKNALPILGDVRTEVKQDDTAGMYLELLASDGESWLQMKAPLVEAEIGTVVCVDAKSFLNALRNLGNRQVCMEIDENKHTLTCKYDNGHFTMPYEDADDFPMTTNIKDALLADTEDNKRIAIDSKKLLLSIEKAGFATANDELRPVMNGVHFDFFADGMVSVASDGHKLAKYKDLTVTHNGINQSVHGFTFPKKPCHILMNVLANVEEGEVWMVFNDKSVMVGNKMFCLTARLIEGRYPNYDSVIPKANDLIAVVDKTAFIAALKRVMPMGNSSSELVALGFNSGMMSVSAEDIDFSKSATETVPCDYTQRPFSIGFKGSALMQLLQNIDGDSVRLAMKEPSLAGVLTENVSQPTSEYTSLLMPMLIN